MPFPAHSAIAFHLYIGARLISPYIHEWYPPAFEADLHSVLSSFDFDEDHIIAPLLFAVPQAMEELTDAGARLNHHRRGGGLRFAAPKPRVHPMSQGGTVGRGPCAHAEPRSEDSLGAVCLPRFLRLANWSRGASQQRHHWGNEKFLLTLRLELDVPDLNDG
eukprot:GGOE01009080.1.p2 GENE.GGOE01009080.1~~GGOE01009080.1.p2  ORF type:complete len:162 (-),score=13.74 GGOE01009080.1:854-1339(-)